MDKSERTRRQQDVARKGALRLIAGVQGGEALSEQEAVIGRLAPEERARAQRLAAAVLRNIDRSDTLLARYLSKKPRSEVLNVLRLATVELLEFKEAPHGAVNAAVEIMHGIGPKGRAAAGMVNAVLRKIAELGDEWGSLPAEELPGWLRGPITSAWGDDVTKCIEDAHQNGGTLDFSPRNDDMTVPGTLLPTGSYRLHTSAQVSALPGYGAGDWWVQDAAAAMAVRWLEPRPGEQIADLCAAPGGKSLQIAAAGSDVTAVDISASRLVRLRENLDRCKLNATIVEADVLKWWPSSAPDAILLDAPCSASGTIRRHPDLPVIRDGSAVAGLTDLQAQLIDHALNILKPGGRLVFATCSLLPAEGEDQLAALLARHSELRVETPDLPGIVSDWITPQGGLRLRPDYWPDRGGMDGFFIARLRKPGSDH